MREQIVLNSLEDALVADIHKLTHEWHCSAASAGGWDDGDNFEFHRKEANKTFNAIGKEFLPWYKWEDEKKLTELWKAFKEEEKDPEFQKKRQKIKQKLIESRSRRRDEADSLKNALMAKEQFTKQRAIEERARRARLRR